jgi:hypothetical protein
MIMKSKATRRKYMFRLIQFRSVMAVNFNVCPALALPKEEIVNSGHRLYVPAFGLCKDGFTYNHMGK